MIYECGSTITFCVRTISCGGDEAKQLTTRVQIDFSGSIWMKGWHSMKVGISNVSLAIIIIYYFQYTGHAIDNSTTPFRRSCHRTRHKWRPQSWNSIKFRYDFFVWGTWLLLAVRRIKIKLTKFNFYRKLRDDGKKNVVRFEQWIQIHIDWCVTVSTTEMALFACMWTESCQLSAEIKWSHKTAIALSVEKRAF